MKSFKIVALNITGLFRHIDELRVHMFDKKLALMILVVSLSFISMITLLLLRIEIDREEGLQYTYVIQ